MAKETKVKAVKKAAQAKRQPVEPTEANLKAAREVGVMEYPLPAIRKALNSTWGEAVAIRHALLKADQK